VNRCHPESLRACAGREGPCVFLPTACTPKSTVPPYSPTLRIPLLSLFHTPTLNHSGDAPPRRIIPIGFLGSRPTSPIHRSLTFRIAETVADTPLPGATRRKTKIRGRCIAGAICTGIVAFEGNTQKVLPCTPRRMNYLPYPRPGGYPLTLLFCGSRSWRHLTGTFSAILPCEYSITPLRGFLSSLFPGRRDPYH
jgi:hypothetical protein